jgi:hypothetical protein
MAQRVARPKQRGKRVPVNRDRRRAQCRAVRAAMQAGMARVVQEAIEAALEAEVTARLGWPKYARRATAPLRPAGVRCPTCQHDWAPYLYRDGHYERWLLTMQAAVIVRVPRVSCWCGGTVPLELVTFTPYQRCGPDLLERAREGAGLCLSLRDSRAVLAWDSGPWLACSTLNRWVHTRRPS